MVVFFLSYGYSNQHTALVCSDRLVVQMSAATAGFARPSGLASAEEPSCFALPLNDGAADLEQSASPSALLKVIPRLLRCNLRSNC